MQHFPFAQIRAARIDPAVYAALIADLAYSEVPTTIMGATLVAVAVLACIHTDNPVFALLAFSGMTGTLGKLLLMRWQRSLMKDGVLGFADATVCQHRHLVATLITAASVAGTSSLLFLHVGIEWHVLATALLFAYCSGVVGRLGVCPALALPALVVSAVPVILTCAIWYDTPHRMTAVMFSIFVVGGVETIQHVYRNAARHVATELDMATLARNDPLTGLFNRLGFREAFRQIAGAHDRLAVHCFDLDGFKAVNDRHGHAAGDRVLVEVARRLKAMTPNAIAARLGGDEFAVIQHGMSDEDVVTFADRLMASLRAPYETGSGRVDIGASLGFTVASGSDVDSDAMLTAADLASYRIKRAGGGVAQGRIDEREPNARAQLRVVA